MPLPSDQVRRDRPPWGYWLLPAGVALLRGLPYLETLRLKAAPGFAVLEVGYNPPDWFAYLAMIRQVADRGAFFLVNPFTTEPQSGRFMLLFHWLMGVISAVTGLEPTTVLEGGRVVLIFGFFGVLWWFLEPVLASRGERLWAAAFIGLGGGLDVWLRPVAGVLPKAFGESLVNATWQAYGWSTFGAMYNPLWIAALAVTLVLLRPILSARESDRVPAALLGFGLALLWWIHPYSTVAVVAISCSHWTARALTTRSWAGLGELVSMGSVFALIAGPVVLWQRLDPVYSAASNGFFGPLALSVFWYPLTFGAVLALAIVGVRVWRRAGNEHWMALASWVVAVAVLHSSPLLNGYHYVMYQHLPLSILAAVGLASLARGSRTSRPRGAAVVALLVFAFATPILATLEAVQAVRAHDRIAASAFDLIGYLAEKPAGNVLAPADLGAMIPAYSHHKVFVGHWFLTPDYAERSRLYERLVNDPGAAGELARLLDEQRIDYLVLPSKDTATAAELDDRIRERSSFGSLELLVLRSEPVP